MYTYISQSICMHLRVILYLKEKWERMFESILPTYMSRRA